MLENVLATRPRRLYSVDRLRQLDNLLAPDCRVPDRFQPRISVVAPTHADYLHRSAWVRPHARNVAPHRACTPTAA